MPLLGMRAWRAIGLTAVATAVTMAIAHATWWSYVTRFGMISARITAESQGGTSAWVFPPLVPLTAAALGVIWWLDRPRFWWLAVPALWPAAEIHWSALAIPVMTPTLAVLLAPIMPGLPAVATIVNAGQLVQRRVNARSPGSLAATLVKPAAVMPDVNGPVPPAGRPWQAEADDDL